MEKTSVDTNDVSEDMDVAAMDKECSALSALFQQIINEMKVGLPNFEEFVTKAGKLHSNLKTTIVVLGSFLDTFQKIADAASNTKGTTRDIGTCLTRIVIRHRAIESRMKTLSGALMDCLVLPIQSRVEDWKKITNLLDKEHHKDYKKSKTNIKKKSEQVARLKKKTTTHGSISRKNDRLNNGSLIADPSVQRLMENCSRDLSHQYRTLHENERKAVKKVMTEKRARYCTVVQCLNPIINEEFGMLSEVCQIEDVMHKLMNITSTPEILPKSDEEVIDNVHSYQMESNGSLSLVSPMTTPSPSLLGSRKNSMTSISSLGSSSSTIDESRSGPFSSKTSSICGSLTDGSPFRQTNSINGDINYCNANLLGHQNDQHSLQNYNCNTSVLPSHDSVDFHSLQFQINGNVNMASINDAHGLRPGSSQSFNIAANTNPKAEKLNQGPFSNSEHSNGQQLYTLRPHTISNATMETKRRPQIDRNTFIPPNPPNNLIQRNNSSSSINSQEANVELRKASNQSNHTLRQVKSDQFQRLDDERRYSTIRRSCRSSPFRQLQETTSNSSMVSEPNTSIKTCAKRPPLPNRCASAERVSITSLPNNPTSNLNKVSTKPQTDTSRESNVSSSSHPQRCASLDRSSGTNKTSSSESGIQQTESSKRVINVSYPAPNVVSSTISNSPNHYAVPKRSDTSTIPSVPNFHAEKQDMVIPQPVYMNSQQLFPQSNDTMRADQEDIENDDDLKTPTVEELSFPGNVESHQKVSMSASAIGCEDISCASSSSSAGSIGSFSSGYGSQSTVVAKGEVTSFDVKTSPTQKSPSMKSNLEAPLGQSASKQNGTISINVSHEANVPSEISLSTTSTHDAKKDIAVKSNVLSSSIYKPSKSTIEGMPNSNVFTIKENSVSTQPSTTIHNSPNDFRDPLQSPFARSQSFNNYIKYRNNQQNTKHSFPANIAQNVNRPSDNLNGNSGAFSLQTVPIPSPYCVWGQASSHSVSTTTNSTFQTQNSTNTITHTDFAPSKIFSLNNLSNKPWSVRRSDSFSPGTRAGSSYNNQWNASHTAMNAYKATVNERFNDNHSCVSESEEKPTATSKPPPPIRRSSSISSQDANANLTNMYRTATDKSQNVVLDDDGEELTPHGSVENLYIPTDKSFHPLSINSSNNVRTGQYSRSMSHQSNSMTHAENFTNQNHNTHLRRSTSMSCPSQGGGSSSTKTVSFTLPIGDGSQLHAETSRNKQIISVNSGGVNKQGQQFFSNDRNEVEKLSPEGEVYGFGEKFRENKKMYFNQSANTSFANNNISPSRSTFPNHSTFSSTSRKLENDPSKTSHESSNFSTPDVILQNQSFLDALSARLSLGANQLPQTKPTSTNVQVSNTQNNWNQNHRKSTQPVPPVQRSPSFGSANVDNGKVGSLPSRKNCIGNTNVNANTLSSDNKNNIHSEIERGAFNLRKTNGILHDRSAPRL